jgi:hypothetical protein
MTPWPRATSFDHVLNNSRASYFAGALLISPQGLNDQMTEFFRSEKWDVNQLLAILLAYNSSPEMFMIRLLNIIPKYFGLSGMFFMRYDRMHAENETILKKELHLSRTRNLKNISLLREHCKAWARDSIFKELSNKPAANCHRFVTEDESQSFMVMALSRPMKRNPNASLSVMLGFEEAGAFKRKVGFAKDESIGVTIMKMDEEKLKNEEEFLQISNAMRKLMDNEKQSAVGELT